MVDNLIVGEYYWVRPLTNTELNEFDGSDLLVGKFSDGWIYPTFDFCGDDYVHAADKFKVISHIERPSGR